MARRSPQTLTLAVGAYKVQRMNDSPHEPSEADDAELLLSYIDAATHRMGRLMAARHAQFQQSSGMPTPQYMVLKAISYEGPMRVSDLAGLMGVKNPAASMILQQLESEGLIARNHCENDNRVVRASITAHGEQRLARSEVFRRELLRRMTADLSIEDLRDLVRILGKLNDTVARDI